MKLTKSKKANENYLAKIVEIKEFFTHPNPKCLYMKCCKIDGFTISIGIDTKPGIYVYFPAECTISRSFLAFHNLFRHNTQNNDINAKPGFFEDSGRVKIIRLQEFLSEGFIIEVTSLLEWLNSVIPNLDSVEYEVGQEFDSLNNDFIICKKFVIQKTAGSANTPKQKAENKMKNKLVDDQFRFHYDTVIIKKCPQVIEKDSLISITEKIHGTSGISSNILCKKKLSFKEKIYKWLTGNEILEYSKIWASRSVIKNPYINPNVTEGFYGVDVWKCAHDIVAPHIPNGYTLYYEIVGYLPSGKAIQKTNDDYDYGFKSQKQGEKYEYKKHFGIFIYRVTYTSQEGKVIEFSAKQVQQWCENNELVPVKELYYGYAGNLYPEIVGDNFGEQFIERLSNDKDFYMECLSPSCKNVVPHEGVVIKIENMKSQAFKLKCKRFLEKESKTLDKNVIDIESEA